jgi:hypothetical protein
MYRPISAFDLVVALLMASLPSISSAQVRSFEDIYSRAYPNGAIVIISEERTGTPGYTHTRYAYIDDKCDAVMVDRYGEPVPYDDQRLRELVRHEQRMCTEAGTNARDGE